MIMLIRVMVMVFPRTGGVWNLSTPRLAVMPTAQLAPHDPQKQVASQQPDLARQRHRDIKIGEYFSQTAITRSVRHRLPGTQMHGLRV